MIPEGWTERLLGELLDYEQPTKYLVESTEYEDSGTTPVLTAGKSFILGYTSETEGLYDKGPTILFDDFTTAIRWVDFPFKVKSSACKMLTARDSGVSLRFVYELMKTISYVPSDHMRHWIGIASQWTVAVPPAAEQRAIAEALSDADALVESLDALIAKKRDMKQATMQQLLTGRTRLVALDDAWDRARLGEVASFEAGTYLPSNRYQEGSVKVQGAGGQMGWTNSPNFFQPIIVIGRVGTIGRPRFHDGDCWVNNNAAALVPKGLLTAKYIYSVLQLLDFRRFMSTTAQPFLVVTDLLAFTVLVPPLAEQVAVVEVLTDMDAEIDALVARREKAELVKQGMMQELLSGRVRLV
jgi:type I restriction enzyme S subunit